MAKVDDLMAMFAARPSTVVCRGPEHPPDPDPSLTDRMRLWLETHPFLHRDEGYVQFLKRYCGAAIGDKASDINLATNAGARGVLVLTGYGRETLANRDQWPCAPEMIADDLLDAVRQILDRK